MGNRKTPYQPKSYESCGYVKSNGRKRADTSANLYESMLVSPAFLDLSPRQRCLYLACKAQCYGKRKPSKDFPQIDSLKDDTMFYLNWSAVAKYGLYTSTMHATFYRDMKVLCEHGFIRQVSSGKLRHEKSIYQYSANWQTWTPTEDP